MAKIRVGSYFEVPAANYDQRSLFTWREFYNFRNHVLRVLRQFGSAGPMGEVDLSADTDDEPSFSHEIVEHPDFFVVDDMYNEHDRCSIVECDPCNISVLLIESLCGMMRDFRGWWVSFSLGDSGLIVSAHSVLAGGRRFWDCITVHQIAERCSGPVDFGPPDQPSESMYAFWMTMISGEIEPGTEMPSAPSRQWAEVIGTLVQRRIGHQGGRLTPFAYDEVRNDLHPDTRRQFILRLLDEIASLLPEKLKKAKRNIQRDCGLALTESKSQNQRTELAQRIWSALEAVADKLEPNEVVNWWADILVQRPVKKSSEEELTRVLEQEIRIRLQHSESLIRLSAIFALAHLHAPDMEMVVDEALHVSTEWNSNPALVNWLEKLKRGKTSYPDRAMLTSA